jgi:two-component system nitrogen regulation response regulator NtrX
MNSERESIKILVVDDEANVRRSLQLALQNEGYTVHVCDHPIQAFRMLAAEPYDLAILDIKMEDISGVELFQKMVSSLISTPVIFVSGNASLSEAALAVRSGAFDFIEKPFNSEKLAITVQRCLEFAALKAKVEAIKSGEKTSEMIGHSRALRELSLQIAKVAPTQATVLIQGESGTGKELIAQQIHQQSDRAKRSFVKVNCSAIPETLLESELFGFEKGAFTGATHSKRGYFEQAHFGTLFLDEIGDMSLTAQAKVLRAIQNSEIQKLGSERTLPINVRLVAATNRDLKQDVASGRFREDLFYRLSVVPIQVAPLRERPEDIPLLIRWFCERYCSLNGLKNKAIDPIVIDTLSHYSWPGNIRELQNLAERLVIMSGDTIRLADLPHGFLNSVETLELPKTDLATGLSLKDFREHSERNFLVSTLRKTNGNISKAAENLKVERTYLHRKITQYAIQKREYFL